MGPTRLTATAMLGAAEAALATLNAYLVVVLVAAALPDKRGRASRADLRFVVLIPAHDEERLLPAALESVARQDYPRDLVDVVVVADHCADDTAGVARSAGATVLERTNGARSGKASALAWAVPRLPREYDALAVLDADCVASPNFLASVCARLADGAAAVQSDYVITNAEASPTAALRAASFALLLRVRTRGKDRLGFSAGLFGTGMAFRREVVAEHSWREGPLEDGVDYHLQLLGSGIATRYMAEANVASAMPASSSASAAQQLRWEAGKVEGIRHWLPRLLRRGIRERDPESLHAALDMAVPSQAILAALNASTFAAAMALRSRRLTALGLANMAAQTVFVLGGLRVAHAPPATYRGLLAAPSLVAKKIGLYGSLLRGNSPGWDGEHRE